MAKDHRWIDNERLSAYQPVSAAAALITDAKVVNMFVQGSVLTRHVWVVAGPDGIASVASPSDPARTTFLVWSQQHEAERWADVLSESPQVLSFSLAVFVAETLPAITAVGGLVGPDWSAEPVETEAEPATLAVEIRNELVRDFAVVALKTRSVWLLQDAAGIAAIETLDGRGTVVPVWADRPSAEAVALQAGPEITTLRMTLVELTNRFLLSPEGLKVQIAPGYIHAPQAIAMSAWAFKALLNGGGRPAVRVA
jgi:hypothetical protein